MKKLSALLVFFWIANLCYSQNVYTPVQLNETDVPLKVRQAFQSRFSGQQETEWEKLDDGKTIQISAYFSKNGKGMVATYNTNGILIELETELSLKEVPTIVIEKFKQKYGLPKDLGIVKTDDILKNYTLYEFSFGKNDVFFNEQGIQIK